MSWYDIDFKQSKITKKEKKREIPRFKLFLYIVFAFFPAIFILTGIHELGHAIMGWIFGWDIRFISVSFFPLVPELRHSWVSFIAPLDTTDLEYAIVYSAGSLHTLIWGYIFFILFYKFRLPAFLEIAFFMYSILLLLDIVVYSYVDLFILRRGDWYSLYYLSPILVGVCMGLGFMNVILFIRYFKQIIYRIDLQE